MAVRGPAAACGSTSVTHTNRVPPSGSANTWNEELWCVAVPPTTDHTRRRTSSSTLTISSRATTPLTNVTTRAPSSRRVSVTNPGARRRCTAPTSRITSHTASGEVLSINSLRMVATADPHSIAASVQVHGLHVVAVGVEQERGVIVRTVVLAHAGGAVVAATCLEPFAMERIDRGTARGGERDVHQRMRQLRIRIQPQRIGSLGPERPARFVP